MDDASSTRALTRRSLLTLAAGGLGAFYAGNLWAATQPPTPVPLKGRIKQSVSRWCYSKMDLDTLCDNAKAMGLVGIDLLKEDEWATVARHGLLCTMAYGIGSIPSGWNDLSSQDRLVAEAERAIPRVATAGLPNIITFSGNRRGLTDEQGATNCVTGLKRIAKLAEMHKVTVCMELLNSKHDHKDYQGDHTAWGVDICKRVGSDRIKLLYDIYHMQIMEGDVCTTIKENIAHIAHFHTGGVPGRHEIDATQELNYATVCKTIAASGFQGFVAHEFLPTHDPMKSLRQAVQICDV
jgi:hydroxypyruvate isomerase